MGYIVVQQSGDAFFPDNIFFSRQGVAMVDSVEEARKMIDEIVADLPNTKLSIMELREVEEKADIVEDDTKWAVLTEENMNESLVWIGQHKPEGKVKLSHIMGSYQQCKEVADRLSVSFPDSMYFVSQVDLEG